jgi:hypothetical protein
MGSTAIKDYPTDGKGYWNLAREWMFEHNEDAIFSRCSDLVIFDLLLRQAELCKFRKELLATSDDTSRPGLLSLARSWHELHPDGQVSGELKSWCNDVRPKLLQYRKSCGANLLRVIDLSTEDVLNGAIKCAALPTVELRRINHIQDLLEDRNIELIGPDKGVYDPQRADIVALKKEMYDDPVSKLIVRFILPWVFDRLSRSKKSTDSKAQDFSGRVIQVFGSIVGTVGAAGYLLAAITTLYHVTSMGRRLAIIAGFSVAHAILLCLFRSPNLESINAISTLVSFNPFKSK